LLAYRWPATDAALSRLIESTGRQEASVRYADPLTGRDIMPTMRAELHRVLAGHRTRTVRTAGSGIWVVYRGSGATVIDGRRFRWAAGDIFVTPSWAPVDHEAADDADLFHFSDAPALEALGLARTEKPRQRQDVLADKEI
jgi:gentisate 1,2-dioxygenase